MSLPPDPGEDATNNLPKKQAGETLKELEQLLRAKILGFKDLKKVVFYTDLEMTDIASAIYVARKIYEVEMDQFYLNGQNMKALINTFCETINKALTIILLAHNRARLSRVATTV